MLIAHVLVLSFAVAVMILFPQCLQLNVPWAIPTWVTPGALGWLLSTRAGHEHKRRWFSSIGARALFPTYV